MFQAEAKAEAEEKGRTAEGRKGKLKSPFRGFRGKEAKEVKEAEEAKGAKEAKMFHEPPPGCKPGKLNSHCFQTVAANGEIRNGKGKLKSPFRGFRGKMAERVKSPERASN